MTRRILMAVLLGSLWAMLGGKLTPDSFLAGLVIGAAAMWIIPRGVIDHAHWQARPWRVIHFLEYFTLGLIKSNFLVAREVLRRTPTARPRIIRYDTTDLTPLQVTALANLITLTAGTLTVDVADDASALFIHAMFGQDRDAVIHDIDDLKSRMMREGLG